MRRALQIIIGIFIGFQAPLVYALENYEPTCAQEACQKRNADESVHTLTAVTRSIYRTIAIGGIFSAAIIDSADSNSFAPLLYALLPSVLIECGVKYLFDSTFIMNDATQRYSDRITGIASLSMLSVAGIAAFSILAHNFIQA